MKTSVDAAWFTSAQASKLMGVSDDTVRRLGNEGRLGVLKIEGVNGVRYRGDDVRALMARCYTPATAGAAAQIRIANPAMPFLEAARA